MIAAAFLMSAIAIGHGIGPVVFLLAVLTFAANPIAFVAYIGILLLLSSAVFTGRAATLAVLTGSGVSFVVWLWLLYDSDWNSTILCSAHYFAAMFYFLVYRPGTYRDVD